MPERIYNSLSESSDLLDQPINSEIDDRTPVVRILRKLKNLRRVTFTIILLIILALVATILFVVLRVERYLHHAPE